MSSTDQPVDHFTRTGKRLPSIDRLRKLFTYDPCTGEVRRIDPKNPNDTGRLVGTKAKTGHSVVCVGCMHIGLHRLIWALVTGKWPPALIDHRDGDATNNRFSNLRLANYRQNGWNRGKSRRNTTGFKGVCFHKRDRKYQAGITVDGKRRHIGYFKTPEEAGLAYQNAAILLHGEFVNSKSHSCVLGNPPEPQTAKLD